MTYATQSDIADIFNTVPNESVLDVLWLVITWLLAALLGDILYLRTPLAAAIPLTFHPLISAADVIAVRDTFIYGFVHTLIFISGVPLAFARYRYRYFAFPMLFSLVSFMCRDEATTAGLNWQCHLVIEALQPYFS